MLGAAWGGSEELWSQVAIQLSRDGHDVSALVPYLPRLSERVLAVGRQGVDVQTYPSPSYVEGFARFTWDRLRRRTRKIYARLKRFSPDLVIISQGEIAGGFEWARVCRQAGLPYVMIVHCNNESLWFEPSEIENAVASYTSARKVSASPTATLIFFACRWASHCPMLKWFGIRITSQPSPRRNGRRKMELGTSPVSRGWIRRLRVRICLSRCSHARNGGSVALK